MPFSGDSEASLTVTASPRHACPSPGGHGRALAHPRLLPSPSLSSRCGLRGPLRDPLPPEPPGASQGVRAQVGKGVGGGSTAEASGRLPGLVSPPGAQATETPTGSLESATSLCLGAVVPQSGYVVRWGRRPVRRRRLREWRAGLRGSVQPSLGA